VELRTNALVTVLLFQFHCIVLVTLSIGVFDPVAATILLRAGEAADEPNVIVPAPFVIVIPAPAVSWATVYPVPLPIKSCPFAGTVFTPVPPCAIGSVPVTPIFTFDVPLKEPAVVEARSVCIVLAVVKDAALPVVFWLKVGHVKLPVLKSPDDGVPKAGVISVGLVANTTSPLPVTFDHVGAAAVPVVIT
jgi:hypothetical protein